MVDSDNTVQGGDRIGRVRLGAVVALAAAAAFVGWLLLEEGGNDGGPGNPRRAKTVEAVSSGELRALPASVGHPVYWAGAKKSVTYELTRTGFGNIYIRYLPRGVAIRDKRPDFLTVATYPYPRAIADARARSRERGAFRRSIAGGGIAYSLPKKPKSVYFTYPRLDYLYEVYDPKPLRARRLVLTGRVRPIG